MTGPYDVIVIGARCAGSPTAMLLARHGHRVLAVDRATFPSDTVSTHVLHPPAAAALGRWGLLERLAATGCPPIHTYAFDFGPFTLAGSPAVAEAPVAYCPRRTVLDKLLVDAAREAGAEVREGFTVDEIEIEGGRVTGIRGRTARGATVTERAAIVVGADGRYSLLAQRVNAARYRERPPLLAGYYTYWRGLPMDGRFETYVRPRRGFAAAPTHDGLTLVIAGWPHAELEAFKEDVEANYLATLELVPAFAARVRRATREARFVGAAVANYFRKPYGPGWALVGDAGYNKDPVTAQGILDAFRDAERCVEALDRHLRGGRPYEEVMRAYQRERDEHALAMYELTCQLATLAPPPPELGALLAAIAGNRPAMDAFVRMNAGALSPADFYAPENVRAMLSGGPAGGIHDSRPAAGS
jgi:2-polyprenyl-6-methoxyphenol hydroxylase-like FAD-dependent oxidoreductase